MCLKIKIKSKHNHLVESYNLKDLKKFSKRVVKTADKDIIVYKGLAKEDKQLRTIFIDFKIKIDKEYKSKFSFGCDYEEKNGKDICFLEVQKGLHACTSKKELRKYIQGCWITIDNVRIFKAIIPAGSKYFINEESGEICSNRMIIMNKSWKF